MSETVTISKTEEKRQQLESALEMLKNKEAGLYFVTPDTKGSPVASVAQAYNLVRHLVNLGYKAAIIHESDEYTKVGSWLGESYDELPHISMKSTSLKVSAGDFVIIPELYTDVMSQLKDLAVKRVVLCQSYDYIFEYMGTDASWTNYGISHCITTCESQKNYIQSLYPKVTVDVIPVSIPEYFKPSELPVKPYVALHCRDTRDTFKIIKTFYTRYKQFRWITFREMQNMPNEEFAEALKECCCSVWVDDIAGFGTFPVESMKCNVPVIGKIPNLAPDYLNEKNGLWTNSFLNIVDLIAQYIQGWLEDGIDPVIYKGMQETAAKYNDYDQAQAVQEVFGRLIEHRIGEINYTISTLK